MLGPKHGWLVYTLLSGERGGEEGGEGGRGTPLPYRAVTITALPALHACPSTHTFSRRPYITCCRSLIIAVIYWLDLMREQNKSMCTTNRAVYLQLDSTLPQNNPQISHFATLTKDSSANNFSVCQKGSLCITCDERECVNFFYFRASVSISRLPALRNADRFIHAAGVLP